MEYDRRQQEAFARKRNLLSDITHDLKTPITTVAGYVMQALNDGMVEDPEKQKQYLESIRRNRWKMSRS